MKKLLLAVVVLALAACTVVQQQTVSDAVTKAKTQIANACLVVQPTLVDIQASMAVEPDAQKTIASTVVADNAKFCAAVASVDPSTAQSLVNSVIPDLIAAVSALPIDQAQKTSLQIALGAASLALSNYLAVYGQAVATK